MVAIELSKIVVVTINVVFMIFGLSCVVVGAIFKFGWEKVRDAFAEEATGVDFNLQNAGDAVGIGAIVFGSFIIIVSLLGCMGAVCKLRPLLLVYAVIIILLVLAQITIVAYAAVKGKDAEDQLEDALIDTLDNYHENSNNSISKAWSAIFSLGECCGVNGYVDFQKNITWVKDDTNCRTTPELRAGKIPITCCKGVEYEDKLSKDICLKKKPCLTGAPPKDAYMEGCVSKVKDWINNSKGVLIGVGATVLFIELLLMLAAFVLFCRDD